LEKAGKALAESKYRLVVDGDQTLTAGKWFRLLQEPRVSSIRVSMEREALKKKPSISSTKKGVDEDSSEDETVYYPHISQLEC
jgi:hypothetical protein